MLRILKQVLHSSIFTRVCTDLFKFVVLTGVVGFAWRYWTLGGSREVEVALKLARLWTDACRIILEGENTAKNARMCDSRTVWAERPLYLNQLLLAAGQTWIARISCGVGGLDPFPDLDHSWCADNQDGQTWWFLGSGVWSVVLAIAGGLGLTKLLLFGILYAAMWFPCGTPLTPIHPQQLPARPVHSKQRPHPSKLPSKLPSRRKTVTPDVVGAVEVLFHEVDLDLDRGDGPEGEIWRGTGDGRFFSDSDEEPAYPDVFL
jgi:hypothetical protein